MKSMPEILGAIAGWLFVMVASVGPWIYHVVWCIQAAAETGSAIALLVVGTVVPPIGWLHGISLLLGMTWI